MKKEYCVKEFRNKNTREIFYRIYWRRRFLTPWVAYVQHYQGGSWAIMEFKIFDEANNQLSEFIKRDKEKSGHILTATYKR